MLIDFDYLWNKYQIKSKQAVHLGANEGQEAETYHSHGIEQVIWVEALPDIHAKLVNHVARYSHDVALCACLSDEDGKDVVFHVASNQGQSSSFLEFGTHSKEHPTVKFVKDVPMKTTKLLTLLAANKLTIRPQSFLNIDLQGAELLALKGIGEMIRNFDYAYIEVNNAELYKNCPRTADIDNYLKEFGLFGVEEKFTGAKWGDKFYIRK